MSKKLKPKPGEKYTDSEGRQLEITEVKPGDNLGREVIGKLKVRGDRKRVKFSTTLEMWANTWRDKTPPIPISQMKAV